MVQQSAPNSNFNGFPWTADQQNWFDTHSSALTWSGTGTFSNTNNAFGDFSYTFHLESNQVAVGTYWDWNGNNNVPILTIYDCPVTGGGACVGDSLPWVVFIVGAEQEFNGVTLDDFPLSGTVPVPAAAWLMGSGLLGLVGIARRRKLA